MVPRDNAFVLVDNVLVRDAEIRRLASPKLELDFVYMASTVGELAKVGE
jgi:hypothetical protein